MVHLVSPANLTRLNYLILGTDGISTRSSEFSRPSAGSTARCPTGTGLSVRHFQSSNPNTQLISYTLDAGDLSKSPIFESDPEYGIGTWGTAPEYHVTDGAFNETIRAYPIPHIIRRRWTPQPFGTNLIFPFEYADKEAWANETVTHKAMQGMIDNYRGDSDAFFAAMEGPRAQGVHNAVHLAIGGYVYMFRLCGWLTDT